MEKLPMCRICLVEDIRLFIVVNRNLHELYEKLTDNPFVTEDIRPILACFFCCAKLKQCYRFLRQCLKAEELFAQRMNEEYEPNSVINHDHLKFFGGFIKSPTVHISIVDVCQTESIAIKEELPAASEILDVANQPMEECQSEELEQEKFNISCLDVAAISPHHSESDLEDDVPLMEFKTEVVEDQEVSKKKRGARQMKNLEAENLENSCVADAPAHHSEIDLEDDVPLMEFKTEMVEDQEVSKKKQRARQTGRAPVVAKKPKQDTRETRLEDAITTAQTKTDKSDSKAIRTTQKRTSNPGAYCKDTSTHARTQIGEKLKCDLCQHSFNEKCHSSEHIRIHTGEKPYTCDRQSSLSKKCVLTRHSRIHTGEKPFQCHICQCSFSQKWNLIRHIRIHTGEKTYKCEVCQRCFSENGNLKKHTRMHTGEKPYECDVCQSSFSVKGSLTQHMRIHTGEKPYKCDVCQRSFRAKKTLKEHAYTHW